jgi:hypothetical protein
MACQVSAGVQLQMNELQRHMLMEMLMVALQWQALRQH